MASYSLKTLLKSLHVFMRTLVGFSRNSLWTWHVCSRHTWTTTERVQYRLLAGLSSRTHCACGTRIRPVSHAHTHTTSNHTHILAICCTGPCFVPRLYDSHRAHRRQVKQTFRTTASSSLFPRMKTKSTSVLVSSIKKIPIAQNQVLQNYIQHVLTVKMASESSREILKRLVLAIWRVIKPFKKQLRNTTNRIARSKMFCSTSSFHNLHSLTFQSHFISANSTVKDLTIVGVDCACTVHVQS